MSISSLLLITIIILPFSSVQAQKLSDDELYSSVWVIKNISLDSTTIFNQDTLILRQTFMSGKKYYYADTTISQYDFWKIRFGEYHDVTIYSVQCPPAGIIKHSDYYTEMYPCLNTVWSRNRKEISLKIGNQFPVTYNIYQFLNHELILVKIE